MGYPLVTVTSSSGILSLSQERFVSDSLENDIPESSLGYTWNIPVFYVNQGKGLKTNESKLSSLDYPDYLDSHEWPPDPRIKQMNINLNG